MLGALALWLFSSCLLVCSQPAQRVSLSFLSCSLNETSASASLSIKFTDQFEQLFALTIYGSGRVGLQWTDGSKLFETLWRRDEWNNVSVSSEPSRAVISLNGAEYKAINESLTNSSRLRVASFQLPVCLAFLYGHIPWSVNGSAQAPRSIWCSEAFENLCEDSRVRCVTNVCLNGGSCYIDEDLRVFDCVCSGGYSGALCENAPPSVAPTADPCATVTCENGGTCFSIGDITTVCRCLPGFTGANCETTQTTDPCAGLVCKDGMKCVSRGTIAACTYDPSSASTAAPTGEVATESTAGSIMCQERPCFNYGTCSPSNFAPGYTCECVEGWTGPRCEVDIKECDAQPCLNNATCLEFAGGFVCSCVAGFTGQKCEVNIDDCATAPCLHDGQCVDGINDFTCQCQSVWGGKTCNKVFNACDPSPCLNDGVCDTQPPARGYTCACLPGFQGQNCEVDIDDCAGVTCSELGHVCVDSVHSYECRCPDGWRGIGCAQDVDECADANVCKNGATCLNSIGGFSCNCLNGFTGKYCEQDVDECNIYNPCQFGICENTPGSYRCYCNPGYLGSNCSLDFNECSSSPCLNNGICVDSANSFQCLCPFPFSGKRCQSTMQHCDLNPCEHGGTCLPTTGGYQCLCVPGYNGQNCQESVDACASNPCGSGTCVTLPDDQTGFDCICSSTGFEGPLCDQAIVVTLPPDETLPIPDFCSEHFCHNNGSKVPATDGSCICLCPLGYQGEHCDSDVVDCLPNTCFNGATCIERSNQTAYDLGLLPGPFSYDRASGFVCICPAGLSGPLCDQFLGCSPNPCLNGAQCISEEENSFTCVCPQGFEGARCEQDRNECEIGVCDVEHTESCVNLPGSFRCLCQNGWAGENCDSRLTGCDNHTCAAGICQPFLTPDQLHSFLCKCPEGKTGVSCEMDTTASFLGDALLAHIISNTREGDDYALEFSLRTTLPEILIVAVDNIFTRPVFDLWLRNGALSLEWQGLEPIALDNCILLNDAQWHTVRLSYSDDNVELTLLNYQETICSTNASIPPSQSPVVSTKFGGGRNGQNLVGCLRDMQVNGKVIVPAEQSGASVNVRFGCERQEQCVPDSCSNQGHCLDLWNRFECQCQRPFLPPNCENSFEEGTFGHESDRSHAQVQLTPSEQQTLEMSTDLSLLVRTREEQGMLAYIGSEANINADLDTFLALEMVAGQLQCRVKLGPTQISNFIGGPRLDDGQVHNVRVSRTENTVQGYVDDSLVFEGKLDNRFAYPLLATYVFVGGYPLPFPTPELRRKRQADGKKDIAASAEPLMRAVMINPEAFATAKAFKGTIQDVRLNGMHLPLFPLQGNADAQVMGKTKLSNVMQGTVSDDTCRDAPCENGGQCTVTFNDFECNCLSGWRGNNCSLVDHCADPSVCPSDSVCENTNNGFLCASSGTFHSASYVDYTLSNPTSESVSMFYTFSLKLRTRSSNGVILLATGNRQFLLLDIIASALRLKYRLGGETATANNVTGSLNVTDGQWHTLKFTLLTEQSYVNVDNSSTAFYLNVRPTAPLSDIFTSGGHLYVGATPSIPSRNLSGASSFEGCLDALTFGSQMPPLTFFSSTEYGRPGEPHMRPENVNFVRGGCHPEEQCTSPDPIYGPCQNGAPCTDLWNARLCDCLPGFKGANCEINIDDCEGNRCSLNGTCVDGIQNYTCACIPGFTGQFCETEINECDPDPCQNEGRCTDLIGAFRCDCNANFTGDMCEILIMVDCLSSPCQNDAQCSDVDLGAGLKSFSCACLPGYTGKACEHEIDYCEQEPCVNGASCESLTRLQDYNCHCVAGFAGKNCETNIDECSSNPCLNGAVCEDQVNGYVCLCVPGWQGLTCADDLDECISGPCQNGANCVNSLGSYQCTCQVYYLGENCELAGSCLSSPCLNGTCIQVSADHHQCQCGYGYEGLNCELEIDFCASAPCEQGGTCRRPAGGPGFECICPPGLTGPTCGEDIDECFSSPCLNGGFCQNLLNEYNCDCTSTGFMGDTCGEDVDECTMPESCISGKCTNTLGQYECSCDIGFIGQRCNHRDPCLSLKSGNKTDKASHRCENLSKCQNARVQLKSDGVEEVKYDCECMDGFQGDYCELTVEAARGVPLTYIVGPILAILLLCCIIAGIAFLMVARKKRATRGTYSPSRQEMTGARGVQLNPIMKPPPEERLI